MGVLAFSVHFSIVIGSAGSEFAFEVIQSDSYTKCPATAKQGSPAFSPPLSVSLTTAAQLQGGASGVKCGRLYLLRSLSDAA